MTTTRELLTALRSKLRDEADLEEFFNYYGGSESIWNLLSSIFADKAQPLLAALEVMPSSTDVFEWADGNQEARIALKDDHALVITYRNTSSLRWGDDYLIFTALTNVDSEGSPIEGYKAVSVHSVSSEDFSVHPAGQDDESHHNALANTLFLDTRWTTKLMRHRDPVLNQHAELPLKTIAAHVETLTPTDIAFSDVWVKRGNHLAPIMVCDPDTPLIGSSIDLEDAAIALTEIAENLPRLVADAASRPTP